jgi:ubiquinol-cytochrome c reductase cytochrome b subunit
LRHDPLTQGPKLFAKHCASCHRFDGHDGLGLKPKEPPAASDLKNYGSREWLAGLLAPEKITNAHYFGATKLKDGRMSKFVSKTVAKFSAEEKADLTKVVATVSAEAGLKSQRQLDASSVDAIKAGGELFRSEGMRCAECHQFKKKDEDATGPDLTGYASREWLIEFIGNPKHEKFYGEHNDRMPAFGEEKILDAESIGLLADWLRGEWYEAPSGRSIQ